MGVTSGFGPARDESPHVREIRSVESLWEPSKVTGSDRAVRVTPTGSSELHALLGLIRGCSRRLRRRNLVRFLCLHGEYRESAVCPPHLNGLCLLRT